MKRSNRYASKIYHSVLLLSTFHLGLGVAAADAQCEPELSKLVSAQGHVEVARSQLKQWTSAQIGQVYCGDDQVRTGDLSRAVLAMDTQQATFLALDQQTLLSFVRNAGRTLLSVERGQVHVRTHTPTRFDISTPFVNAGIEGTEFLIQANQEHVDIRVFEGNVRVFNAYGEMSIGKGQTAFTRAGTAPTLKQLDVAADDAVRWALYYPPLIDFSAVIARNPDPRLQQASDHYQQGNVLAAIEALQPAIDQQANVDLQAIQIGLLLTLGQVDRAESLIQTAQAQATSSGNLDAFRAIIALSKNAKEQALQFALAAVAQQPQSSLPWVALSYVEQAFFRIDGALQAIEKASSLSPANALIHCRQAELLTSQGELESAKINAYKALTINPNLGRVQVVIGFIELMTSHVNAAFQHFENALGLDGADPLAHFGLGLAFIHIGDVVKGIEQLEIAASLDPNDALTRSYLGKAYYDQNRVALAQLQFELAKQQDPQDPTPYHYEAILKQNTNRPIQALIAIREAMSRNDNRAVYRSQLLLDQDLAARSASLARIYSDLGFDKLAFEEASQSILHDPGNFSAHRFLADTYATMPRHEVARVSEVLQMQLWQPKNLALLQPQLNQAFMGGLQTGGAQQSSFREYNPLFMHDGAYWQTSGLVASNNTFSDDAVLNYQQGKLGFSFGQYHYQTQGFRKNADLKQDLYDGLLQLELTPSTSIQAEFRRQERQNGDVFLNIQPDLDKRENDNNDSWRLGMRHVFSPRSAMIANFTKIDHDNALSYPFIQGFVRDNAASGEAQHVYRFERADVVNGFSYYQAAQQCAGLCKSPSTDIENGKFYNYSTFNFPTTAFWTLGMSGDYMKDAYVDSTTLNPKFGLTWLATPETTLRLAAFKTTKFNLTNNQTIEPTQVAGFSQLFDEADATQSWRVGAGVDHRLSKSMMLGYEWSQRRLKQPYSDGSAADDSMAIFYQRLQRAYWNVVFLDGLVGTLDYQYSDMNAFEAQQLVTHKVPFRLSFFNANGLSATFKTTFYHQQGLYPTSSRTLDAKKSSFVTLDLAAQYRLPNRHGMISLGILNLLDQDFLFTDYDSKQSMLFPERVFHSSVVLSFQ